jgi:hypothetical protein
MRRLAVAGWIVSSVCAAVLMTFVALILLEDS